MAEKTVKKSESEREEESPPCFPSLCSRYAIANVGIRLLFDVIESQVVPGAGR
jgi:hypothetical protein